MEGRAQKKGKYAGGVEAASEDKGKEWRGKEKGGGRVQRKSSSALWKENGGSLAWAGVWMGVGHLLRGSGPKVGKTPICQDFLSLSWHHRVCPPATLEPSWPRTSRTEGAGEVGCDITLFIFPGLLQSSVSSKSFFSPLASEQMGPPLSERRGSIRGETLVLGRSPESNMLQSHASSYHTVGKPG